MAFGAPSLKGHALRYLSQREHSRAELERKLARHLDEEADAAGTAQIAQALDELAARGLQSEQRVAESVLRSQGARFGSRRLKQTMQAKGLAPELVSAVLRQAAATELARARDVWRRRFGTPPASAAERAKQQRFLAARGFAGDVIRQVVAGADDEDSGAGA